MNLHVCVESSFTFQNVREEVTEGETMLMSHLRPLLPCFRVEETARSEVGERGREAEALIAIGRYSMTIETVDVGWCKEITDQGATLIAQSSKSLRYLGLMRCDKTSGKLSLAAEEKGSTDNPTVSQRAKKLREKQIPEAYCPTDNTLPLGHQESAPGAVSKRGVRFLHPPLLRTELCETRVTSLIPLSLPDGLEKHCLNKAYKVNEVTVEQLVQQYPHITFSTVLQDCKRTLERAYQMGWTPNMSAASS
ncbi:hypothetical protein PANDA_006223 [Ailuropoda melanoleuca]|uniref:Uncharacterized protein n=1 Tax=Ailuropoda melanoleuca TaxID=9646 RepID=D2H7S3_AILME|nr:hypothetical protein PANDA_006223 [Ailuropoda melanoleuca]